MQATGGPQSCLLYSSYKGLLAMPWPYFLHFEERNSRLPSIHGKYLLGSLKSSAVISHNPSSQGGLGLMFKYGKQVTKWDFFFSVKKSTFLSIYLLTHFNQIRYLSLLTMRSDLSWNCKTFLGAGLS